jgi:urate oxidase
LKNSPSRVFHTGEGVTKIKIVVATRASKENFMTQTATERSLQLLRSAQVGLHLHASNATGLPELYDRAIKASAQEPCALVFMRDDLSSAGRLRA